MYKHDWLYLILNLWREYIFLELRLGLVVEIYNQNNLIDNFFFLINVFPFHWFNSYYFKISMMSLNKFRDHPICDFFWKFRANLQIGLLHFKSVSFLIFVFVIIFRKICLENLCFFHLKTPHWLSSQNKLFRQVFL